MNQKVERKERLTRRQWLGKTGLIAAGAWMGKGLNGNLSAATATPAPDRIRAWLNYNESPYQLFPSVRRAIEHSLARASRYPVAETAALLQTIGEQEGLPPSRILLGAGSGPILEAAGSAFGAPGRKVIWAEPGYGQLVHHFTARGGTALAVPVNSQWQHDLPAMMDSIDPDTAMVYVCNPNNPTGTVADYRELARFCRQVAEKVPVFVDEAYLDLSTDFPNSSMAGLVREGCNIVVSRTFSKLYGLAGLRIGYAMGHESLLRQIQPHLSGSIGLPALVAAKAALGDVSATRRVRQAIISERDSFCSFLREQELLYAEPHGNFVFFRTGLDAEEVRRAMREEGVEVGRPFPPMRDWCRISLGTAEEMRLAQEALQRVLHRLKPN